MSFFAAASAIRAPLMAFLAMGAFWGAWHALVPDVKVAVGADDGALGLALLFVAVGAVPAMVLGGRLVDRLGQRLLPVSILLFAVAAVLPALGRSPVELSIALFAVGLASGLMDIVMNARIGAIEARTGLRAMHLAHGLFAVVYLIAALGTGVARDLRMTPIVVLLVVAVSIGVLAAASAAFGRTHAQASATTADASRAGRRFSLPVVLLGVIAFTAFLAENGWQSWSALFLERTFGAEPWLGSMGPAVVGIGLVFGRFGGQIVAARISDGALISGAVLMAMAGGMVMAIAPTPSLALGALFVAAAGVSVIAPSALSLAGRTAPPKQRGGAVAAVGVIAYTGFFAGPALLGFVAEAFGLRLALGAIVGILALVIPCLLLHRVRGTSVPAPNDGRQPDGDAVS